MVITGTLFYFDPALINKCNRSEKRLNEARSERHHHRQPNMYASDEVAAANVRSESIFPSRVALTDAFTRLLNGKREDIAFIFFQVCRSSKLTLLWLNMPP